jgi:hypothetical protein
VAPLERCGRGFATEDNVRPASTDGRCAKTAS